MSAYTEQEAKERWCPFARVADVMRKESPTNRPYAPAANRFAGGEVITGGNCIASECMAWRWLDAEYEKSMSPKRPDGEGWAPSDFPATGKWQRPVTNRRGCCGLAGTVRP